MKVVVYNKKGGAGKTPIATNIAQSLGWAIAANENNGLAEIFPPDRIMEIEHEEEFPDFPDSIDIVFDLGGMLTERSYSVLSAIKQADLVLIPIFFDKNSISKGIQTYNEVKQYTKNIVIVVSRLKTRSGDPRKKDANFSWSACKDFLAVEGAIKEGTGDTPKMIPLQESDFYLDVTLGKSLAELRDSWPLQRKNIQKIIDQFELIFNEIASYE